MDEGLKWLAIIGIGGLLVSLMIYGWWREKKRREDFQKLAKRLGLKYRGDKDYGIPEQYRFLDHLCRGSRRYAFNIIEGNYEGQQVQAFDFHYRTQSTDSKGRRKTNHHYSSFFILRQPHRFPELRIYPEGVMSKLGQMIGFEDIDFESVEFSKAFVVRSQDKKFAYDICHPRMMEYLLSQKDVQLEVEGNCIAIGTTYRLKPEQIEQRLDQLLCIQQLVPRYVFETQYQGQT